jgi:hypothetical protein
MRTCGHRCCSIATNSYHVHLQPPQRCSRCAEVEPLPDEPGQTDDQLSAFPVAG